MEIEHGLIDDDDVKSFSRGAILLQSPSICQAEKEDNKGMTWARRRQQQPHACMPRGCHPPSTLRLPDAKTAAKAAHTPGRRRWTLAATLSAGAV